MQKINWNNDWLFWEDKDSFALIWSIPEDARKLALPHDAMIENEAHPDSPSGNDGAYRDGASYVYCKEFTPAEDWRGAQVEVFFEGVSAKAMVYLNEQRLAMVPYGYSSFKVDLSDYLVYGTKNSLRVICRTADMPSARWYTGGGIYRDVTLRIGGPVYTCGATARTLSLSKDTALIKICVPVSSCQTKPCEVNISGEILSPAGKSVSSFHAPLYLKRFGKDTAFFTLAIDKPLPWSDETPALYTCKLLVGEDSDSFTFGIRTVTADAARGLLINGKSVKLRGACVHHDNGLLGAVSYKESEYRRIALLKKAGFNALRSAHQPLSVFALMACDELGMFVMDEAFDTWTRSKKDYDYAQFFDTSWEKDVESMITKDYNHPSVIMYSLGNEIPEIATPAGSALYRKMHAKASALDDTRLILCCINGIFASGNRLDEILKDVVGEEGEGGSGNVNAFMAATATHADEIVLHRIIGENLEKASVNMDLVGYNYMTARYEPDSVSYPNRVMVGSETYPPEIARSWEIITRSPQVIGDFTWTGWDYIGEAGVGIPAYAPGEGGFGASYPCQLAYCGDLDITGYRRPASYYREIVFGLRTDPFITVQDPARYGEQVMLTPWVISDNAPCWDYKGLEQKNVIVEVYGAGTHAELFVNDVSLGKKELKLHRALFETVYTPGVLKALSYDNDICIGEHVLKTPGTPSKIRVSAEPSYSGDTELVYLQIEVTDREDVPVSSADTDIEALVTGGTLLALGSGNPKPLHPFAVCKSRTGQGRAQCIIKRGTGTTSVTITSADFGKATMTL